MRVLFSFLMIISCTGVAQTATSIAAGNWTNPMIWSCTCVPTPGYTVVINHAVTLNTDFLLNSGSITVNSSGSLLDDVTGRNILMNGGSLTNNGTVDVKYIWTQTGTFSNTGTFSARSMLNNINFTNTGIIQNVDSLYTTGTINNNGSFLNIDSITNATTGSFNNNGTAVFNQFTNNGTFSNANNLTFTDITNNGLLMNSDTMIALNSGWNQGSLVLISPSYFLVNNSFLNRNLLNGSAVIANEGRMNVLDSWYNFDTIKGVAGSFIVADTSYNSGRMNQTFDFCDLTPPMAPPYVDINLGVISSQITWCQNTSVAEHEGMGLSLSPNPAGEFVFLSEESGYRIFDMSGRLLLIGYGKTITLRDLPSGLFIIETDQNSNIQRHRVLHQN
ncbi:MAG: hypothetical protein IT233_08690 [Bacteroidia bacterium]|nr:hypothetical protein [Bacteroidia bacterium]